MSVVDLPKLYTAAEVAESLRCNRATIRRMRKRGEIGFVTVGKKVFYTAEHVNAYLKSREVPARS